MPFAFIIVGLVLAISGVKGTSSQLLKLVQGDIQGKDGYLYWAVAVLIVGAVGYIPVFKNLSVAFLSLILVVLILKEGQSSGTGGGFFGQFTSALTQISQGQSATATPAL